MIFTFVYGLKYPYQILTIFNQIYFIHIWGPNRRYHSDQSGSGSNDNEGVLHTPQSSRTGVSTFSVTPRTLFLSKSLWLFPVGKNRKSAQLSSIWGSNIMMSHRKAVSVEDCWKSSTNTVFRWLIMIFLLSVYDFPMKQDKVDF